MIKKNTRILILSLSIITSLGILLAWYYHHQTPTIQLFKTELPQRKTITQVVNASGVLEIKDLIKIGSNVSGIVQDILVKENQYVKKSQLLAIIDPGTGETDYNIAEFNRQKAQEAYVYKKSNYERIKKLYEAKQLAQDAFEKATQDYISTELDLKIAQETVEKQALDLRNRKINAVDDGYVTTINIAKGMSVSGANVSAYQASLVEIAPDITEMEAKLDIDESDIGFIKPNQEVKMTVNTYPDMHLFSIIADVGFSPKTNHDANRSQASQDTTHFYQATVAIKNKERLLKPGMLINAKINIAKVKKALCASGLAFQINYKSLKTLAEKTGYGYKALTHQARSAARNNHHERIKFLWILEGKNFIQRAVTIGSTDDNFFEIKTGITENDQIIIDVVEDDEMQKLYNKWFSGPL